MIKKKKGKKKCKEAHLKREDKEYVSNNRARQMDLIEPQSDGCFFFLSSLFLCNPLLSLELHLWNESRGRGRRGARRIFRFGRGLSYRRRLIMAEAVFFPPLPGILGLQEFDLQLKIIDHFCPLGRFSGGPKANTLYHTVSFKHHMPAASQPRICERKYLEPPRCVSTPPNTHTHADTGW